MFDYKLFITLIIAILGISIPIYINLKKEINDLKLISIKTKNDNQKIKNREKLLNFNTIFTIICILMVLFFSFIPILNNINLSNFNILINFFSKTLPFKKGFFENSNFAFSFITEIILSLFFVAYMELMLYFTYSPFEVCEYILYILMFIVVFVISSYILIWLNYFISSFLSIHITQYFKLFSLIINIVIYSKLINILIDIFGIISDKVDSFKKR